MERDVGYVMRKLYILVLLMQAMPHNYRNISSSLIANVIIMFAMITCMMCMEKFLQSMTFKDNHILYAYSNDTGF